MSTLLTMAESKARVISHERALEIVQNEYITIHTAEEQDRPFGKMFTVELTSDLRLHPKHEHPMSEKEQWSIALFGLGFIHEGPVQYLLDQWLVRYFDPSHPETSIPSIEALDRIAAHKANLEAWLERSRGW